MYEMMFQKCRDLNVCAHRERFPKYLTQDAVSLLKKFLNTNPRCRLGARGDTRAFLRHPFLKKVNWEAVLWKHVTPPGKPQTLVFFLVNPAEPGDADDLRRHPSIKNIHQEAILKAKSDVQKVNTLADHFAQVFQPHTPDPTDDDIRDTLPAPDINTLPASPIKTFTATEVRAAINRLHSTKAPVYDPITGEILKQLPTAGISAITYTFNSILRTGYFPGQWKVSQIITILKPGKPAEDVQSYRPFSLLPVLSKVFEKLFIARLQPILQSTQIIPDHQFGFRHKHATIEQVHRIISTIHRALENKHYCTAAFLDISQAFDKVWHEGLLYKLKTFLPLNMYNILQSYLTNRHFRTKYREAYSSLRPVLAGVPQGSVLGPLLYLTFTADLPTLANSTTATFADDTAILTVHENPAEATHRPQLHLNEIQSWLKTWRIRANETKSVQVTFTLNKLTCPPVQLNNEQLPQADEVKYLGIHLDRRLTWRKHITTKRKQ